ncbi:hypothetical protein [Tunturiibacter gelidiferens]|uniref:hypothetical protein n=1 Tax=Tunturiibacter gelidiferens TaxID=3069689 RepID=UPI003D9BE77D
MRDRERRELKKFREEYAAEEERKREVRERPIRELEAKLNATHREIAKMERARLSGEVPDSDRFIDDVVKPGITIPHSELKEFTQRQAALFISANPDVYWCPELVELLGRYFSKNGLNLVTASMIKAVVDRMRDVGMLPEPPKPEPVREPALAPVQVNEAEPKPEQYEGFDLQTGEPKTLSRYEVDRMSSEDFKRFTRLRPEDRAIVRRHW